ncbi:MAG: hypothetical protein MHMPM18_002740 [Marteilia pararefringens]
MKIYLALIISFALLFLISAFFKLCEKIPPGQEIQVITYKNGRRSKVAQQEPKSRSRSNSASSGYAEYANMSGKNSCPMESDDQKSIDGWDPENDEVFEPEHDQS